MAALLYHSRDSVIRADNSDLLTSAGGSEYFVAKYDNGGAFQWGRRVPMNRGTSALPGEITVDPAGNIVITGGFRDTIALGGLSLTSQGVADAFVAKLDPLGNFLWASRFGSAGDTRTDDDELAWDIASDGSGNVYTTGHMFHDSTGGYGIFVAKHDNTGKLAWLAPIKRDNNFGGGMGMGIAVDSASNVYTTGFYRGRVDFDPGSRGYWLTSVDDKPAPGEWATALPSDDIFILKLNSSGGFVWGGSMGGEAWEAGRAVALDAAGNVYVTGYFAVDAINPKNDFNPAGGTATPATTSGPAAWAGPPAS